MFSPSKLLITLPLFFIGTVQAADYTYRCDRLDGKTPVHNFVFHADNDKHFLGFTIDGVPFTKGALVASEVREGGAVKSFIADSADGQRAEVTFDGDTPSLAIGPAVSFSQYVETTTLFFPVCIEASDAP